MNSASSRGPPVPWPAFYEAARDNGAPREVLVRLVSRIPETGGGGGGGGDLALAKARALQELGLVREANAVMAAAAARGGGAGGGGAGGDEGGGGGMIGRMLQQGRDAVAWRSGGGGG